MLFRMSETQSVSQGCFVFRPKVLDSKKKVILPDPLKIFSKQTWHESFKKVWGDIEKKIENLEDTVTEGLLNDLIDYISNSNPQQQIPTAAILTGINLPDHGSLFNRLSQKLKNDGLAKSVATLKSQDCISIRHTIERTVMNLMSSEIPDESDDSDDEEEERINVKKTQCTMPHLVDWYTNRSPISPRKKLKKQEPKLVIILQDFETFCSNILHDYIQILSGYRDRLPIVLIFGIATQMTALSDSLSHKTTSRLSIKTFQSQRSVYFLNNTLNKVFLTPDCPFQMSRKLFQFFTNVFLFYDFSVNRFTQGLKYCLMEHFREGKRPVGLLCTNDPNISNSVQRLKHADLEWIRNLESFKNFVKTSKHSDLLMKDDSYTRTEVLSMIFNLKSSILDFYSGLDILYLLVSSLPQAPLGKHFREIYCAALNKDIINQPEYKECRQLLGFLSKEKLLEKLDKLSQYLSEQNTEINNEIIQEITKLRAKMDEGKVKSPVKSPRQSLGQNIKSRAELKKIVIDMGTKDKGLYEKVRDEILDYLMYDVLSERLEPFTTKPLWEIVTLVESDARYRVVPRIRAPIHTALNNPSSYLLCGCCKLKDPTEILPSMPDICIAYKLHLESGNLINMYDWLQSFNMIVSPKKTDAEVDPKVQARFTQAVAELEYLGFVKSSKQKADHVQRLTWAGQSRN